MGQETQAPSIIEMETTNQTHYEDVIATIQEMVKKNNGKINEQDIQELMRRFQLEHDEAETAFRVQAGNIGLQSQVDRQEVRTDVETSTTAIGEKATWLKEKYPELSELINAYPERIEDWQNRALLIESVKHVRDEIIYMSDSGKQLYDLVLREIQTNQDNDAFTQGQVETKYANSSRLGALNQLLPNQMTLAVFLARVTNESKLVFDTFHLGGSETPQTDPETQLKSDRLVQFLSSYEKVETDPSLKERIISAFKYIQKGDIEMAIQQVDRQVFYERRLKVVDIVSSDSGLFDALRAIGNTRDAAPVALQELARLGQKEPESEFGKMLNTEFESKKLANKQKAESKYQAILTSIKGTPLEYDYTQGHDAMVENLSQIITLEDMVEAYIEKHGTENLPLIAEEYNDMKGISGLLNLSDENAHLTKEASIMIASFLLTAGLGTGLSIAGAWVKGVRAETMVARAERIAAGGGVVSTIKNAGSLTLASTAWTGEKILNIGIRGIANIQKMGFLGDAFVFTASERMLHFANYVPGEKRESVRVFAENFFQNTAMFGVFAGFGKITGALLEKYPTVLAGTKFAQFGTLASGDMAGLYMLHCIETGEFVPTADEMKVLVLQVIGFRGAMKGMENLCPKLMQRFTNIAQEEHSTSKKATSSQESKNIPKTKENTQADAESLSEQKLDAYSDQLKSKIATGETLTDIELKDLVVIFNDMVASGKASYEGLVEHWNTQINHAKYELKFENNQLSFVEKENGRIIDNTENNFTGPEMQRQTDFVNGNGEKQKSRTGLIGLTILGVGVGGIMYAKDQLTSGMMPFGNPETGEPSPTPSVFQELPDTDATPELPTVTQNSEVPSQPEESQSQAGIGEENTPQQELVGTSETQPQETLKATPDQITFYKKYNVYQLKLIQEIVGTPPDGTAGSQTVGKVIDFQNQHGLYPDGKVGSRTLGMMVGKQGQGYKIISIPGEKGKIVMENGGHEIDEHGNSPAKRRRKARDVAETSTDNSPESHYEEPPSSEAQERTSEVTSLEEIQQSLREIGVDSHVVTDTHLDVNVGGYHSTIQLTSNGRVRFHSDQFRGRENEAFDFEATRIGDVVHNIQTCIQIQQKSEALARATQDTQEDFMGDNFDSYQEVNRLNREIDNLKRDLIA